MSVSTSSAMTVSIDRPWAARFASLAGLAALTAVLAVDLGPFERPELQPLRSLLFVALGIGGAWSSRRTALHNRSTAERAFLAAFCWLALASVLSPDPVGGALTAVGLLGTFALGTSIARSLPRSDTWLGLSIGMIGVLTVGAIIGPAEGSTRWAGLSEEPNALAVVAALAAVVGIVQPRNRIAVPVVVLGGVSLLATNAAIPTFAAAVGCAIWVTRRWPTSIRRGLGAAGAAVTCGFAVAVIALPADALPGNGYNLETINERTQIWSYLGERIDEAPVLGQGPGAAHDIAARGAFDIRVHWGPQHAHNAPLELAMAGGLPAAALFVVGCGAALVVSIRRGDSAATAVLATIIVLAFSEPLVRDPSAALLLLGLAAVRAASVDTRAERPAALSEAARIRDNSASIAP